jgi:hypothetical protein
MAIATLAANAPLQSVDGKRAKTTKEISAEIISERFGIYKVKINGQIFSVDYKFVTIGG